MAHGALMGNATVTNGALQLTGATGDHVNLPGGLVSGSSAVTIEFWAAFGVNGNGAQLCDFGNISGGVGQNYLLFSPHSPPGARHRLALSTSGGTVAFDTPGTLDNRTVHVVCLADPATGYSGIYTNGVLENVATNTWPALTNVSSAWSFVGRSLSSADAWLNATIDEIRIYDGRLTPDEIAADYRFGPDALALPVTLVRSNAVSSLAFSWPSWAVGFMLETTPALDGTWTPATPSPALVNDQWRLTQFPTNGQGFYRLRR
jgi:hypothetical protein